MRKTAHVALLLSLVVSCGQNASTTESGVDPVAVAEGEAVAKTSELGPVKATVSLRPSEPKIGDVMELVLEVTAEDGVKVQMPAFQEALSRFSIEAGPKSGDNALVQRYRLYAATSGRLRIPPLRVVFFDERPGQNEPEERELLTEEISLNVASVLPGDPSLATLHPVRDSLDTDLGPSVFRRYWWVFLVAGAAVLAAGAFFFVRRERRAPEVSPYERAFMALTELEQAGLPDAEGVDTWYVTLSAIVRRYLEDNFALRAPELTTEEFLRVAKTSDKISEDHKKLLNSFLMDCDRVKFAAYEPKDEESMEILKAARKFLLETHRENSDDSTSSQEAA